MESVKFFTAKVGPRARAIKEAEVGNYAPAAVRVWSYEYNEPTVENEIEVGRRLAASGLIAANSGADRDAVLLFKGSAFTDVLSPKVTVADGAGATITGEKPPRLVVMDFGLVAVYGRTPSDEEIAEAKNA